MLSNEILNEDNMLEAEFEFVFPSYGTSNYEELENKPSINGVELVGNKTDEDLGIGKDFVRDANYVHTDNNYTDEEKTKLESLENYNDSELRTSIDNLQTNKADKSEIPDVSSFITKDVNNLTNYYDKTTTDNKLQNKANASDIPDVSNFITKSVDDLVNYYIKSETYTQTEVNELLGNISTINIKVVDELPDTGIENNIIYLVPTLDPEEKNVYEEYMYINSKWELIGTTKVDLTDYAKKSEIPSKTSQLTNDSGYITSFTEQDPTVPAHVKNITENDINNWNNKATTSYVDNSIATAIGTALEASY